MRMIVLSFLLLNVGSLFAQTSFKLMGETRFLYTTVRQIIGVSYHAKASTHTVHIGYDKAYSLDKRSFGLGYQYSYTMENGLGIDANVYGRYGKELDNGYHDAGASLWYCYGSFVLEEAIGLHYSLKKKYLKKRLTLTPFVRVSLVQGFDQVQEVPFINLSYKCDVPLRDVSIPYIGLRYSYRF